MGHWVRLPCRMASDDYDTKDGFRKNSYSPACGSPDTVSVWAYSRWITVLHVLARPFLAMRAASGMYRPRPHLGLWARFVSLANEARRIFPITRRRGGAFISFTDGTFKAYRHPNEVLTRHKLLIFIVLTTCSEIYLFPKHVFRFTRHNDVPIKGELYWPTASPPSVAHPEGKEL